MDDVLANLSDWPAEKIEALRQLLKGNIATGPSLPEAFDVTRSLPHGHVAAVLGMIQQVGVDVLLDSKAARRWLCVLAMIANRIMEPGFRRE